MAQRQRSHPGRYVQRLRRRPTPNPASSSGSPSLPCTYCPADWKLSIEVRNLLAQGYRPVLSADGSTVYLVQGTRCIRAGLTFNF